MPSVFSRDVKSLKSQMTTTKAMHASFLLDALRVQMREICHFQELLQSDLWLSFSSDGKKGLAYMLGMTLSEYGTALLIIYEQLIIGKEHDWNPIFSSDEEGKTIISSVRQPKQLAFSLGIKIVDNRKCGPQRYYCINLIDSANREQKHCPENCGMDDNPFRDTNLSDEDYKILMTAILARPSIRATQMLLVMTSTFQADNVLKPVILLRGEDPNILVSPVVNQYNTHFVRTPVTEWQGSVDETAGNEIQEM